MRQGREWIAASRLQMASEWLENRKRFTPASGARLAPAHDRAAKICYNLRRPRRTICRS